MKKFSNTEAELNKRLFIKKACTQKAQAFERFTWKSFVKENL